MSWDDVYNFFGIKSAIYFISSSALQDYLFPVKLVFVIFAMFFLAALIYFMINSSWLKYKFLEDATEFFSKQSYGMQQISRQWDKIKKRTESGSEADYKLAIIEADDFLVAMLEDAGYDEDTFEATIKKAARLFSGNTVDVLSAHEVRNAIVYNPDFALSGEHAKRVLEMYGSAINNIGVA